MIPPRQGLQAGMTSVRLPQRFEHWARIEVAAGRAKSVEDLAAHALDLHRLRVDRFRASLRREPAKREHAE